MEQKEMEIPAKRNIKWEGRRADHTVGRRTLRSPPSKEKQSKPT